MTLDCGMIGSVGVGSRGVRAWLEPASDFPN